MTTLEEAFTGFFIAILLAIILAVLMDSFPLAKKAFYPLFIVSQTIPIIILVPLLVMWFGFDKLPKIIVVILVCFFPIVVNLLEGLESVDRDMLNLFKSMKSNYFQIFKFAKFPASLGNFFSGLKIAATYSIMGAVIGEWMGGKDGLGVYMTRVRQSFALDKVFSVIVVIVLLSLALFQNHRVYSVFNNALDKGNQVDLLKDRREKMFKKVFNFNVQLIFIYGLIAKYICS